MENTLQAARADDGGAQGVELTAAGRLLIAAVIAGAGLGAWRGYEHYAAAAIAAAPRAVAARVVSATPVAGAASVPQPMTQALLQERAERRVQAAAWRTVADANRQQIAALAGQLQALESKIGALEKIPPAARASREAALAGAALSARAVRPALDAARDVAQVDVSSLPVEAVSAQSLNLTGFGNGVIQIGNQKLAVGQAFQPGEMIVAVDPVSRSIVTNRRILNITN